MAAAMAVADITGYMTIPTKINGVERAIIFQWFAASTPDYTSTVTVNFPIPFPNNCLIPLFTDVSTGAADLSATTPFNLAVGRAYYTGFTKNQITCAAYGGFRIFAIGW